MVIVEQSDGSKIQVAVIDSESEPENGIEVKHVGEPLMNESDAPEQKITINKAKMDFDGVVSKFGIEVAQAVENQL